MIQYLIRITCLMLLISHSAFADHSASDSASEYLIFIKDKVKAHYHEKHTELVYVLAGTADFWLAGNQHSIKAGDFIRIEQGVIHKVKVTSTTPLKVISIQTPKFDGKDRIFVE